jgi:hypothetical protein
MINQLADAKEDFDHWLELRKGYLSSSEVFTWIGNVPDWWGDRRADVLAGKQGIEKTFDGETETSIAHGSFDEENIQAKFGHAVGCEVQPHNGFFVNDRWPLIGASIDGFGRPWDYDLAPPAMGVYADAPEVHAEFSQDRTLFPYLRDYIDTTGTEFITEVKKSTSVKWKKEVPEYYVCQVQTQLAVLEMDYAIIMAETIHRGEEQKWRNFWDMRAYVLERDPKWEKRMDKMNREFAKALKTI